MERMKFWLRSKTLWVNSLFMVLAGLEMNWHFLRGVIGDTWWGIGAFVVAMINIFLRLFTTQPITMDPAKVAPPQK